MEIRRRIRVCFFNTWVPGFRGVQTYLTGRTESEFINLVTNPLDADLVEKARLDCDWYAENVRCFAEMRHAGLEFLPAWVCGPAHLVEFARAPREAGEERWLITMGHQPQALGTLAGKAFELLSKARIRHLFYAFDEASREMRCFSDIAPYLNVFLHDESPVAPAAAARLKSSCRSLHRSWVANTLPFATPFNETPEEKIIFLGSQLGLTPHRQRQIDHLQSHFKDRFRPFCDHSISVGDRGALNRYKVGLCPEGRKFTTPAMALSHTDRPFWSGCLGMVPVSEDSKSGGRLESLLQAKLILRYPHADLKILVEKCEEALALPNDQRRRIYDHFNSNETVGGVVADAISRSLPPEPSS